MTFFVKVKSFHSSSVQYCKLVDSFVTFACHDPFIGIHTLKLPFF